MLTIPLKLLQWVERRVESVCLFWVCVWLCGWGCDWAYVCVFKRGGGCMQVFCEALKSTNSFCSFVCYSNSTREDLSSIDTVSHAHVHTHTHTHTCIPISSGKRHIIFPCLQVWLTLEPALGWGDDFVFLGENYRLTASVSSRGSTWSSQVWKDRSVLQRHMDRHDF